VKYFILERRGAWFADRLGRAAMAGTKAGKQGAKKKAPKKFSAVAAVKRNAREQVGQPPPERVIPGRTSPAKREKHKPSLAELQSAEQS
jgi:hypothetical protein